MPRPIWTGTISFGLLNIPVTLHTAERTTDLHLIEHHRLCERLGTFNSDPAASRLLTEQRGMLHKESMNIRHRLALDIGPLHRTEQILQQLVHTPYLFDHDLQRVRRPASV